MSGRVRGALATLPAVVGVVVLLAGCGPAGPGPAGHGIAQSGTSEHGGSGMPQTITLEQANRIAEE
jgi:hypothetical protein